MAAGVHYRQMSATPWQTLGVSEDAPAEEIKAAYRALARAYHPDVDDSSAAQERWHQISAAWNKINSGAAVLPVASGARVEQTFVSLFTNPLRVEVETAGIIPLGAVMTFELEGRSYQVEAGKQAKARDVLVAEINGHQVFIFIKKAKQDDDT